MDNETRITNDDGELGAVWHCILTDEEMKVLASGVSPHLIRPDKLMYYAPLIVMGIGEKDNG